MKGNGLHKERDFRELANTFHAYGINVMPTGKNSDPKTPILPPQTGWGDKINPDKGIHHVLHLGSQRQALADLSKLDFSNALGIAGIVGSNDIRMIDFDPMKGRKVEESVITQALDLLGLEEDYEWTVKSGKGFHIWIQLADIPFNGKGVQKYKSKHPAQFQHLELRLKNCYAILPYSQHESGNEYQFCYCEQEFPDSLPVKVEVNRLIDMVKYLCEVSEAEPTPQTDNTQPSSTNGRSYDFGEKALETAVKMIEQSQDGFKWEILNKASYLCGGYVGANLLNEQKAYDILDRAISRKPNVKDLKHARDTIKQALQDGAKLPFKLEDLEHERQAFLASLKKNVIRQDITVLSKSQIAFDIWLFDIKSKVRSGVVIERNLIFSGLYRDGIISFLAANGYYKRYKENQSYFFIQEEGNIISEVESAMMKDFITDYVEQISKPLHIAYDGLEISVTPELLKETLLRQDHLIFNDNFLGHLHNHTKPILKDDRENCYIPFQNTIVHLTKQQRKLLKYEELRETCIWKNQILERNFTYVEDNTLCHYAQFLKNVSRDFERLESFRSAIGYLIHNFSNPTKGQAVICYDEQITDLKHPQGGTGKGLFAKGIKELRSLVKVDGKKFDSRDKFCFQEVRESTQVVWVDDVKPNLSFDRFNSILTDGWNVEYKYISAIYIPPQESPKVLICSNSILESEGSTRKRRQFIIEFGNYYSRQIQIGTEEPIIKEHGCTFFSDDWNEAEWNMFYSFMLDCVSFYLNKGLVPYMHKNILENRIRQTLGEDFYEWAKEKDFKPDQKYETKKLFEEYIAIYDPDPETFKQRSFTNMLKQYASMMGWNVKCSASHGTSYIMFTSGN